MPNRSNNTTFLISCLVFSVSVSTILFLLNAVFALHYSIELALVIFFVCFGFSFLFFYFVYQKIIYTRIERTVEKLKHFTSKKIPEENYDYTYDAADPLEQLNQEIIKIAHDRQKEIEHLTKMENYRKEYLGNVSHELKTPIFNIQGYVSTLIDGGINDPSINVEYLKRADKSIDRMINIIDDLETISQLETGSLIIETEKFDVVALCKDVMEQLEMVSGKKNLKIVFEEDYKKTLKVYADKFRIRQVFVNLITNSIKYGKENGQTRIKFKTIDDKVVVDITDNGIGISEEHLPRLFERFYRIDKGRSREQGGTGLGLSIVKHIIEAHDQHITVASSKGEGTTFTFTLKKA
ncbi:MAG: ATP-binding protein [Bacteroidota bacterium]|nr:ATP-binding protein [Bacteroidota bacterium]